MKSLAVLLALMLPVFSQEPIKVDSLSVNGREYKQASIVKFDDTIARVTHASGAARIPMKLLPEDIQKQLGYDPTAEKKALEAWAKAEQEKLAKAQLDSIPATRFWVSENTPDGLIVGGFEKVTGPSRIIASSMSRVGGGGSSTVIPGKTTWERTDKFFFIPHTKETIDFPCDHEFEAKTQRAGTQRLDESEVVEKLNIISILPAKSAPNISGSGN